MLYVIFQFLSMKFYETHFDDYLRSVKQAPIHDSSVTDQFPHGLCNTIIYGPPASGKYSQMLHYLCPFSPSNLKYESKITITTEKLVYKFKISDIHYEIDMGLLGCNAKTMWHEIYVQIVDVVSMKPMNADGKRIGVIVCKNFHLIHSELLDIFYSYMQQYRDRTKTIQLYFVLLTEHVSFIPNNIQDVCLCVHVPKPPIDALENAIGINKRLFQKEKMTKILKRVSTSNITNLKELYSFPLVDSVEALPKDYFNTVCDAIIHEMENKHIVMTKFRDCLYDILVYGLDVADCVWYILSWFIQSGKIHDEKKLDILLDKIVVGLKQYGNNYRAIFHLEMIFIAMICAISP